jgi:hypothetical protein
VKSTLKATNVTAAPCCLFGILLIFYFLLFFYFRHFTYFLFFFLDYQKNKFFIYFFVGLVKKKKKYMRFEKTKGVIRIKNKDFFYIEGIN